MDFKLFNTLFSGYNIEYYWYKKIYSIPIALLINKGIVRFHRNAAILIHSFNSRKNHNLQRCPSCHESGGRLIQKLEIVHFLLHHVWLSVGHEFIWKVINIFSFVPLSILKQSDSRQFILDLPINKKNVKFFAVWGCGSPSTWSLFWDCEQHLGN